MIEFYFDMSENIIQSRTSGFSDIKKSFSSTKEYRNMTSIRLHSTDIDIFLRNLLLSSKIIINENQVLDVVQAHLNDVLSRSKKKSKKSLKVQRSLKGYLGFLNELLHTRHVFQVKMEERLKKSEFNSTIECLMSSGTEDIQSMVQEVERVVRGRKKVLREIFRAEWVAIGQMKKDLEMLVDNCRICEKRVKVFELVKHSDICEVIFKLKEKLIFEGNEFLDLDEKFNELMKKRKDIYLATPK